MEFIIVIVIIGVIVFFVKKQADKAKAERLERERIERQQKSAAAAKSKKAKFEVITEAEKQRLAKLGDSQLNSAVNAFKLAVNGDAKAMLFMGITYQQIQVSSKSFYWMEKSANAGNSEALYWLGEFYVSGYGVQANRTKGVSMIMQAATKGNKLAIQSLKENGMSVEEMRSCGIPV